LNIGRIKEGVYSLLHVITVACFGIFKKLKVHEVKEQKVEEGSGLRRTKPDSRNSPI